MDSEAWVGQESWVTGSASGMGLLPSPRATSNTWVRETVALELSYVNSNLQLLKEELAELGSSADVEQPEGCETPGRACPLCGGCSCGLGASGEVSRPLGAVGLELLFLLLVKVLLFP